MIKKLITFTDNVVLVNRKLLSKTGKQVQLHGME